MPSSGAQSVVDNYFSETSPTPSPHPRNFRRVPVHDIRDNLRAHLRFSRRIGTIGDLEDFVVGIVDSINPIRSRATTPSLPDMPWTNCEPHESRAVRVLAEYEELYLQALTTLDDSHAQYALRIIHSQQAAKSEIISMQHAIAGTRRYTERMEALALSMGDRIQRQEETLALMFAQTNSYQRLIELDADATQPFLLTFLTDMPPETLQEGTPPVPPPRPSHLAFDPITVPTPNPFDLFEGASTSSAPAATHEGISIARPLRPNPPSDYVSEWNFSDNPNHHAEGLSPMTTENAVQTKTSEHSDQSTQTLVDPGESEPGRNISPFPPAFSTALIGPHRTIPAYIAYQRPHPQCVFCRQYTHPKYTCPFSICVICQSVLTSHDPNACPALLSNRMRCYYCGKQAPGHTIEGCSHSHDFYANYDAREIAFSYPDPQTDPRFSDFDGTGSLYTEGFPMNSVMPSEAGDM
ncbi:hypothetical protein SCP_0208010 [Sparassis crispa]|uniref:Uncharacterized protein n=1 Tax=Sparassis crispa TaxID=139825 RepID=A0A401GBS6_9APHY|nr:hypothetical protein SCP_0208010 [Sparassis crispa]GBE79601.1 hypothetical protein SCP_0208010 [Sparassis crispa]